MKNNFSISFTSNIRFVERPVFSMMRKSNYIDYSHFRPNILKANEFFSDEIRTCTGGGLVKPFVEAEGFHFWDDLKNKKKFPQLINMLFNFLREPQRGLLLGSKDLKSNPYSIEQFENLKKVFLERVKNVSIFQQHRFTNSETAFHYSVPADTWTLCTSYRVDGDLQKKFVKKPEDLLKVFKKVSIANGDRLFMGKKEVLPSDYPELFM